MSPTGIVLHAVAFLLLGAAALWGARLYPGLPDLIPTHWGPSGEPDAFSSKSVWSAFGALMVGFLLAALLLGVHLAMRRGDQVGPVERRTYDHSFSYLNLVMAIIFAWVSLASWHGQSLGAPFVLVAALSWLPMLVIVGLNLSGITAERKRLMRPDEPSLDPQFWVLGGILYRNPDDPRTWVPKPPHTGVGATLNVASSGGRLVLIALLLLIVGTVALPFLV